MLVELVTNVDVPNNLDRASYKSTTRTKYVCNYVVQRIVLEYYDIQHFDGNFSYLPYRDDRCKTMLSSVYHGRGLIYVRLTKV